METVLAYVGVDWASAAHYAYALNAELVDWIRRRPAASRTGSPSALRFPMARLSKA